MVVRRRDVAGFDLADLRVPVTVWQGRQDAMVPYAHGVRLAEHVPTAEAHLFDDEGHLSLVTRLDRMLADLRVLAGVHRPTSTRISSSSIVAVSDSPA